MVAQKIVIAMDDSECARLAARWTLAKLVKAEDEVHVIGVKSLVTAGIAPEAPLATAGAVAALHSGYHQALKQEEERVCHFLEDVRKELTPQHPGLHTHCLPAAGGASGVGKSIVSWVEGRNVDLLVLGSRGMGSAKGTFMSMVGLGSVSKYCMHNLKCPVCIVHGSGLDMEKSKRIMVAIDDSSIAQHAQTWAIDHIYNADLNDELHLVCTAMPQPYVAGVQAPVGSFHGPEPAGDFDAEYRGALNRASELAYNASRAAESQKIAADEVAATGGDEYKGYSVPTTIDYANEILDAAVVNALDLKKVPRNNIRYKALEPEGGASDVGLSIKHYAEANKIDVVIMGSRGMGAIRRAVMSFVGLGSVSEWCVANLSCPVIIVRGQDEKQG